MNILVQRLMTRLKGKRRLLLSVFIHQWYYSNQSPVAEVNLLAGYRSASKNNYQLRVFMLPALNTVRKLHFYKLAFPF